MDNQEERIGLQSVETHYMPAGLQDYEDLNFPIDHEQIRNLLGQILTQVEAMVLPQQAEKANKAIFTQMIWRWFDAVMDNSMTSSQGCIAPIKIVDCSCDGTNSKCDKCTVAEPIKVFRFVR